MASGPKAVTCSGVRSVTFTFYTYAFSNTKVNGFFFINLELTSLLIRYYNARSKPLPYAILITSYNSKSNIRVIYYIRLTL
jgi:hypothetical protein